MKQNDSLISELQNRIFILEKSNEIKSELNKLKSSTIQDLQSRTTVLENKNSEITYSDYISGFSLLLSLITAISLVSYFFSNWKMGYRRRYYVTTTISLY